MEAWDSSSQGGGGHRGTKTTEEPPGKTATEGCHHTAVREYILCKRGDPSMKQLPVTYIQTVTLCTCITNYVYSMLTILKILSNF